jgi:general secretion pathway protein K
MKRPERGAALLTAMLTVALVASIASAALWQQWRQVEIETAERGRSQTVWLMTGALDWTRMVLREDALSAQNSAADHLGEPWALPVQELKLSTFLSQDQQWRAGDAEVFLSGQMTDAQSRLNVMNLVDNGQVFAPALRLFSRLFEHLNLPEQELQTLARQLVAAAQVPGTTAPAAASAAASGTPLMPQQTSQLVWLGLSPGTLAALENFITLLPEPTVVNLNTAPAEVLMASVPGLNLAAARQLVQVRQRGHWATLDAARLALGPAGADLKDSQHSVNSRYFEVLGRMRIDNAVQQDRALLKREGSQVTMLWRIRSNSNATNAP